MGDGSSELKKFWHLYLGWWWLLVLGVMSFVAAAYSVGFWLPPEYKSSATIIVEPQQQPGTTSQSDVITSESLADNYAQLIKLRPTLQKVLKQISPILPDDYRLGKLSRSLQARVVVSKTGGPHQSYQDNGCRWRQGRGGDHPQCHGRDVHRYLARKAVI